MPDTSCWCSYLARPFQKLAVLFRPQRVNQARPSTYVLAAAQHRLGIERWWQFPTLCWLDASDGFLYLLCGLGVGLGCLVMLGLLPALNLLVLWVLYLSFATVGQPWL